jgi:hypothetical protein
MLVSACLVAAVQISWAQSPSAAAFAERYAATRTGPSTESLEADEPPRPTESATAFNWKGALSQSGLLLATQHSLRMVQGKTRAHLGGPFWRDYVTSVSGLSGWNDGNPVITNYVGHPMMGAITGFVQIQNDPHGVALEWDPRNPAYWKSRVKALGWATGLDPIRWTG